MPPIEAENISRAVAREQLSEAAQALAEVEKKSAACSARNLKRRAQR